MLRRGRPTASEFCELITPEWKVRTGQTPQTYLYGKVAEMFCGAAMDQANSWAMEQGSMLEKDAIPYYELMTDAKVERVGFVTTDDLRIGCSPDGLIGEDGGIEVKCPTPPVHLQYLVEGVVPKQYLAQVHGCMLVTGRPWWVFMSYNRHFPPMIVRVERDEKIQTALWAALRPFLDLFDEVMGKVDSMKGPQKNRKPKAN